ncbi:Uncharacterized protein TCAP_02365 [Tolypocladium capitatum]|uniref:DUF7703 domain-containing protein n=1 Tax=Tolypocladium capitatum TaxID=45235 RepID=A0A2K3QJI0_9HYPO|nr:Uncharacterized protein TCAP_02365 [Tolypocladium capitatum]
MPAGDEVVQGEGGHGSDHGYWSVIVVFLSVALFNVLELNFMIAVTFKRFRGLYFWSFLVATWGVAFNAVGYLLRDRQANISGYVYSTIILVGWCTMTTGQSLVLYSRLHFVLHNPTRLRWVLIMIIVDAIWLGVPIIILVYGTNSSKSETFMLPYSIFEKLQLSVFFVQEIIISGLYIYETSKLLKLQRGVASNPKRRVMTHLMIVNIFIVMLDLSILGLEFSDHYDIQTAWKPLVYSVKLKVEFSVLNRLVEFSQHLRTGGPLQPTANSVNDVALERYIRNSTRGPADRETEYRIRIGAEPVSKVDQPPGFDAVKTTAVTVTHTGRQFGRGSREVHENGVSAGHSSPVDDIQEGPCCASSVSSEVQFARR